MKNNAKNIFSQKRIVTQKTIEQSRKEEFCQKYKNMFLHS